jgi:hypothetical protein
MNVVSNWHPFELFFAIDLRQSHGPKKKLRQLAPQRFQLFKIN